MRVSRAALPVAPLPLFAVVAPVVRVAVRSRVETPLLVAATPRVEWFYTPRAGAAFPPRVVVPASLEAALPPRVAPAVPPPRCAVRPPAKPPGARLRARPVTFFDGAVAPPVLSSAVAVGCPGYESAAAAQRVLGLCDSDLNDLGGFSRDMDRIDSRSIRSEEPWAGLALRAAVVGCAGVAVAAPATYGSLTSLIKHTASASRIFSSANRAGGVAGARIRCFETPTNALLRPEG